MSFGHALYYPHINITNKNWLKNAFLFWDKLSRIVPSSIEPSDSEDVIKLKYETGFLEDHAPERYEVSQTFKDFGKFLMRFIESREFYDNYQRRHRDHFENNYREMQFDSDSRYRRTLFKSIVKSSGTYLHVDKIDENLKKLLFRKGLAIPGDNSWEDWIKIDNDIGYLYMTYLAKSISKSNSLPIVTDVEHLYSASILFEPQIFKDYNADFEYRLGNLLIATYIPKNINNVPLDKLIEIRRKYNDTRLEYFNTITGLCQNIQDIDNKTALEDALNHYSLNLINQTEELKRQYESNKIDTICKFLNISLPSTLVSLSNMIPIEFKSLGIGAGLLFGILSSVSAVKKEKQKLQSNPLSYLLNINSELSGENLFRQINQSISGLRRF